MAAIVLKDSLVNRLGALARSEGLTLEAYLERWAAQRTPKNLGRSQLSGEELERLLDAETASNATYRGSYPRADIYREDPNDPDCGETSSLTIKARSVRVRLGGLVLI